MSNQVDATDIAAAATRTGLGHQHHSATRLGSPHRLARCPCLAREREDLQVSRSYKLRGAFTLISSLPDDERHRGVVCASAGNHALGVAYSCQLLGVHARVFLPTTTPRQKRQQIKAIGGDLVETIVVGHSYDEASASAKADSSATGSIYVHPFDDPRTIAGQGTVAVEITDQMDGPVGTLLVPLGGGGLLAGVATWFRAHSPSTRIIGVEPAGAPSMTAALAAGRPVEIEATDHFVRARV